MIRVTKRDGTYAPWDTTKIRKVLQWANIGLDSIQYLELESHVENVTRDGSPPKKFSCLLFRLP